MNRVQKATTRKTLSHDELLMDAVRTNSALMTLTHFRASVSKYLSEATNARRVLDFSAGWGDRLTGFLASPCVEHIVLIDPRPGSLRACESQHLFVESTQHLDLYQDGAEVVLPQLPTESVDLIVSSPPYFDLEHYGETEKEAVGQIRNKVSTLDQYLHVFLKPVLYECERILVTGGTLALNIDDNSKAGVLLCRPALDIIGETKLRLVGTAGLRKAHGFGQGIHRPGITKAEPVYIFRKHS